jgi:hypothetical protein
MGLIKTAMMSGAAMYGVHQLAKTAQHHDDNRRSDTANRQMSRSPNRQYPVDDRDASYYYRDAPTRNAQDRNTDQYYGAAPRSGSQHELGYYEDGARFFNTNTKGAYESADARERLDAPPPQYYSRSYDERVGSNSEYFGGRGAQRPGYVVPDDVSEPGEGGSGSGGFARQALKMAAGSGTGGGRRRGEGEGNEISDLVSGFLKKR